MELPRDPGIYVLAGYLSHMFQLEIRSLGITNLPAGIYCYCGSAKGSGGLHARISRHLKKGTKKFWHFDYLKEQLQINQVWWQIGKGREECEIAQFLAHQEGSDVPVKGFGSSDCTKGCISHLIYFKDMQIVEEIYRDFSCFGHDFTRKIVSVKEIG